MALKYLCVISGLRRKADDNCTLLGYYAASCGNFFTDVSGQPVGPIYRGQGSRRMVSLIFFCILDP